MGDVSMVVFAAVSNEIVIGFSPWAVVVREKENLKALLRSTKHWDVNCARSLILKPLSWIQSSQEVCEKHKRKD